MKQIKIKHAGEGVKTTTKEIITLVISNSPQKQLTIDEMRKRVSILQTFEAAGDKESFVLEDAEHQVLVDAIKTFPWALASKELLSILDDFLNAETINISALKVVNKEKKDA